MDKDTLDKKIKTLPENIQQALYSPEIFENLRKIGERNKLHLDQLEILEDQIALVILGDIPSDDLVDNLEQKLQLGTEEAIKLAVDINEEIFLPIRESIKIESQDVSMAAEPVEPDKNAILSEIENPTPTIHPISAADQTVPGPAMQREVITEAPRPAAPAAPAPAPAQPAQPKQASPQDFVANKLTQAQNSPAQKVKYSVDPYREPIS